MWKIVFTKQAQKDAEKLAASGLKNKAAELLKSIKQNPYEAPPTYKKVNRGFGRRILSEDQYSTSFDLSNL